MRYEYKTVGAPERVRRRIGRRSRSDRLAAAMGEILNAEAQAGWEYQRTDLIPVEEPRGFWGGVQVAQRAVMVFRRPVPVSASVAPDPAPPVRIETPAPTRAEPEVRLAAQTAETQVVSGPAAKIA